MEGAAFFMDLVFTLTQCSFDEWTSVPGRTDAFVQLVAKQSGMEASMFNVSKPDRQTNKQSNAHCFKNISFQARKIFFVVCFQGI